MRIGLLSDTHGDADIALRAVQLLQDHEADYLIHCGDIGSLEVLDAMDGIPGAFVFGNNDFDRAELSEHGKSLGLTCLDDYGTVELDSLRLAVTHGDDAKYISRATGDGCGIDYLFTGHTHERRDVRIHATRWINPGALYRASTKTVAVLDLKSDTLTALALPSRR